MVRLSKKGEKIRQFILENIENNPHNIANNTAKQFDVSCHAINKHIQHLIKQGALIKEGKTKNVKYRLHPQEEWTTSLDLATNYSEDVIWRNEISPELGVLPDNTINIWHYGFTEMFNNVIDHSESKTVLIGIRKTSPSTEMIISDTGIGIFNKIKSKMGLLDSRQAVVELTKGKLTTDPDHHTGEGIFFTSRMFDEFGILSGDVYLSHKYGKEEDWILETTKNNSGTYITMKLKNNTARTTKEVFDKFSADGNFGFTKTIVPVRLAQYGNEQLISRSQAKRLLDRVDRFKVVILDFNEVESIGQAFADEIFRVFIKQHPQIRIIPLNENDNITQTIKKVQSYEEALTENNQNP
jgi:anti-sigma regulatory factor (Ser/Thr protein kinase)/biotin operon repressor